MTTSNKESIADQKKSLRLLVSKLKSSHDKQLRASRSIEIMRKIELLPEFKNATTILAYWSFDGEVETHNAVIRWSQSIRIILPSVDGDIMNLKVFKGVSQLVPGDRYSIPEPDGELFDEVEMIDLAIIPGIAFDRKNNRMGRGKAYYDRFLSSIEGYKVGVCFGFQLFDEIPVDHFDKPMNIIVTEGI